MVEGLAQLGEVRPGRGHKPTIPQSTIERVVELTLHSKPAGETHWSCRTMAQWVGISSSQMQRIWSARGLKPHLMEVATGQVIGQRAPLTECFVYPKVCGVELDVAAVAALAGRSERAVQLAVRAGVLPALRRVGRSWVIDDVAALAWVRALGSGRVWSARVQAAALVLLEGGRPEGVVGSELSRLRRRLVGMSVAEFAHAAGGLGGAWGRYRRVGRGGLVGVQAVPWVDDGVVGRASRRLVQVEDLAEFELRSPVALDADGDLLVVERGGKVTLARRLVDSYLVGDSRASHAAAEEISRRLARVQ